MDKKISSERLKELRENYNEKGISHEKLERALFEEYGIKISYKQLMNYEAAAKAPHSKEDSVLGMSAKTLYALAKFYNVSTDYILGFTDIKVSNIEIRKICEETGLNEDVAEIIFTSNYKEAHTVYVFALNLFGGWAANLLKDIIKYLSHNIFKDTYSLCGTIEMIRGKRRIHYISETDNYAEGILLKSVESSLIRFKDKIKGFYK